MNNFLVPYLKAGYPVIYLLTAEENRAELTTLKAAQECGRNLKIWSHTDGFFGVGEDDDEDSTEDPVDALEVIKASPDKQMFVFRDFHHFLKVPKIQRLVRDIAKKFRQTQCCMVIISPINQIPPELEREITLVEFELPTRKEIEQTFDNLYKANKKSIGTIDDSEKERIIQAAMGLTTDEAEAAFAKAIVERNMNQLDTPISKMVLGEKAAAVRKSGILEYFEAKETMGDIGGLENLKKWLQMRSKAFSTKAREFGLPMPRGILLAGIPGCVAAGTKIIYKRGKRHGGRTLNIEELYAKFNNIRKGYDGGPSWDHTIPTFAQSWDQETGRMIFAEISHVLKKGEKTCIRITTDDAGYVEVTKDHPILMADGEFCEASDIIIGDKLLVRGSMLPKPKKNRKQKKKAKRASIDSLPIWYKSGSVKKVNTSSGVYEYKRQRRSRLVIEAHMNGLSFDEYVEILRNCPKESESMRVLGPEFDVHHIDEDAMNDNISNLMVMLSEKHKDLHHHHDESKFDIEYTRESTVVKIEDVGVHETFDISIKEPGPHNFSTSNGIILHNCGKSLSAKATSNILGIPLIRFDVGRIFGGLVGQSEENMRSAIQTIEAIGNCVCWVDEMDKAFAGMGGGSTDGGTSQRVFGNFITWMQEKTAPVFIVATVNRIDALPPELLRKGRFDEIFFVGLPSDDEREDILKIHVNKYGRDADKFKLDECVNKSTDFSGAELEEAVISGLYHAFYEDRDLESKDILKAIKTTNPLAKSRSRQLEDMAKWATGNAVNASVVKKETKTSAGRQLDI
ncbi:MAG: AAA family ATPase [Candidatus Lokiarchaeota archaeon]|nr:AAA family ATPase [Candidatus Lokiarchaeota archaeon]